MARTKRTPITVRLTAAEHARLIDVARALEAEPTVAVLLGEITVTNTARTALMVGLGELEKQYRLRSEKKPRFGPPAGYALPEAAPPATTNENTTEEEGA